MELVVYSYNIHSGKNILYKPTLQKMIKYFQENKADLLGLQEVQNNSKYGWQFLQFKNRLGLNGIFGENLPIADGGYGNASFSRWPMDLQENYHLPSRREQRGILHTVLSLNGQSIHCYNTHLGLRKKERNAQLDILRQLLERSEEPTILLGDFNSSMFPTFRTLEDLASKAAKANQPTMSPFKRRLDYIYASNHIKLVEYEVVNISFSDHFPIRAVLRI